MIGGRWIHSKMCASDWHKSVRVRRATDGKLMKPSHLWLLLTFALRVYALDAPSLWNDEGTSVALALLGR